MLRFINLLLLITIIALHFRLWSEDGGIPHIKNMKSLVEEQKIKNKQLEKRNREMRAQVENLSNHNGMEEIEERARNNLGLIKEGETFFLVIEKE